MNIKNKLQSFLQGSSGRVKIGKKYVGQNEPVFVIAEIGINHNGDMEIAKALIDKAADAGVDAVKFQKRTTTAILTKEGLEKVYDSPNAFAPTYGEHREKLEFNIDQYRELKEYSEKVGVLFFASVWDENSADVLEDLGIDAYKIPSADTINTHLLEYVAKKDKPVLLSTGMNTELEILHAVKTVQKYNKRIVLFHCLSLYPSPEEKINMKYMDVLRDTFNPIPVGYSGHETDLLATLVAVSRGACIVERHFTLDKNMKGGDHKASLDPKEMTELVSAIRRVEVVLGKSEKIIDEDLIPLRQKLAKSIASRLYIPKGTLITRDMLVMKGPGTGFAPYEEDQVVGHVALQDIEEDTIISKESIQ